VHRVGGLADTVMDASPQNLKAGRATGFAFDEFSPKGLRAALRCAFELHAQPRLWAGMQRSAMQQRFDWHIAAERYASLYRSLKCS
jgi:starch synthase